MSRLAVFLFLTLLSSGVRADISVTDDAGRKLRISQPAQRIVSLAPHVTELLFSAGAGAQVVAVAAFSNYPLAAQALPVIDGGVRLDIGHIAELRPDLAVGWLGGNSRSDLDKLESLGIPVFIAEPHRLESLPTTLLALGRLAGSEKAALRTVREYRVRLAKLREEYHGRRPIRVFLEVSTQPLVTLNYAHLANDVLALCGGRNIFAASEDIAPAVGAESVTVEDPDAILFSETLGTASTVSEWWRRRSTPRAVRDGQLYSFTPELLLRQSPRILEGARQVCAALDQVREREAVGRR